MAYNESHLLVCTPCTAPSHTEQEIVKVMMGDSLGQVMKDTAVFAVYSWSFTWNTRYLVMQILQQPYGEAIWHSIEASFQQAALTCQIFVSVPLEAEPPALVKPSNDGSSSWCFYCSLIKNAGPDSRPTETCEIIHTHCCFRLLIICYTAIND